MKIKIQLFTIGLFISCFLSPSVNAQSDYITNGNQTRLFAGYTAKMLERGQGQLQTLDFLVHSAEYSVTDFITLGIGGTLIPDDRQLLMFKLKVGKQINDRLSLAIGNIWLIPIPSKADLNFISPVYAISTFDLNRISLTGGIGVLFSEDKKDFIATIGAIIPLSRHFSLVSENWWGFDPTNERENIPVFSLNAGGRYALQSWTFEVGLSSLFVEDEEGEPSGGMLFLPYLSIGFHF